MKRIIKLIPVGFTLWLLSFSAMITVLFIPNEDACDRSSQYAAYGGGTLYWACDTDTDHKTGTLQLGITQDEYEASMHRDVMRTSTMLDSGTHLVDPNDAYVRRIAELIMSMTESEWYRITAALNFVQSSISYRDDYEVYGGDFIQTPMETLYLRSGDCEDTSVLLMSIYLAMGVDAVLLDYKDHAAVGVVYDGEYLLCETACGSCRDPICGLEQDGEYPRIESYGENGLKTALNDGIGRLRNIIRHVTGL